MEGKSGGCDTLKSDLEAVLACIWFDCSEYKLAQGIMKNRQWIQMTIAYQETGAVPYNFMFTPPAEEIALRHYGGDSIEEILDLPIRMNALKSIKPLFAKPAIYGETIRDEFGVVWCTNNIDRGAPIGPCLAEPDLSHYQFPDAIASYRFEDLGKWCQDNREHYTIIWIGDLWERATFMRGMGNTLKDLILNPKFVEELLRHLTDYLLETMEVLFDRFAFDGIALSDDYGAQKSMLMSPTHWRRLIKPRLVEIYTFAKSHGRTVFQHSCGSIYPIIGDMVDIGLDILHPIQPEALDIFKLKREFGRELTFCGGIRTQDLLPRGTVGEVRDEVRKLIREMGRGGGYILEPGISIQADVPLDNLVAMIDEAMTSRRNFYQQCKKEEA